MYTLQKVSNVHFCRFYEIRQKILTLKKKKMKGKYNVNKNLERVNVLFAICRYKTYLIRTKYASTVATHL